MVRTRLLIVDGVGGELRGGGHVAPDLTVRLNQGFAKHFDLTLAVLGPTYNPAHRALPRSCRVLYLPPYRSKWQYLRARAMTRRLLSEAIVGADLVLARIPAFHAVDALALASRAPSPAVCLVFGVWEETIGQLSGAGGLFYPRFGRVLTRSATSKSDLVLAQGTSIESYLRTLGISAVPVIESPMEREDLTAGSKDSESPPGMLRILTISRLVRSKNVQALVDAIAKLRSEGIESTLEILGDGELRRDIQARVEEQRLGPFVSLLGHSDDRSLIRSLLRGADVFALPSLSEGVSYSVMEAMAAALPVVAAPVGGLRDILVHNRNAVLVPAPPTAESLAAALGSLARDPNRRRRLGAQGRVRAETLLHDSWVCRFHEIVTDRLLDRKAVGRA